MTGLKELRETMLSCALKHSAVDLRGASERTECRETMRERGGCTPDARHTQETTVRSHRCTENTHTHTHKATHSLTLA